MCIYLNILHANFWLDPNVYWTVNKKTLGTEGHMIPLSTFLSTVSVLSLRKVWINLHLLCFPYKPTQHNTTHTVVMAQTTHSLLVLLLTILHIAPPTHENKMSTADLAALSDIKNSLSDIPGTNFLSTWDFTSPDPCSTFSGITCSLSRVTTLTLGTGLSNLPGLSGSLLQYVR